MQFLLKLLKYNSEISMNSEKNNDKVWIVRYKTLIKFNLTHKSIIFIQLNVNSVKTPLLNISVYTEKYINYYLLYMIFPVNRLLFIGYLPDRELFLKINGFFYISVVE